jgi:hypothetical protein
MRISDYKLQITNGFAQKLTKDTVKQAVCDRETQILPRSQTACLTVIFVFCAKLITNLKSRISGFRFSLSNFKFQISGCGLAVFAFLIFNFAFHASVFGQIAAGGSYMLEKSVTAAGGASGASASAGGTFTVEGTIGQFGVGTTSQAALYKFYPGFWTPAPLAPTAASVLLGGRVATANGRGISGARIVLTGAGGETRFVVSTMLGYYRFADVQVGETYILTIYSKRFTFISPTQIVTLSDARDDVNFIAEDN